MARIRTIKPEFWQDEKLAPCDPVTRLVFLGLISMADDLGRVLDNVKIIDAFIFPESSDTSRESLATLSRLARVTRGKTVSGQRVIQIVNWDRHQKVDRPSMRAALPEIVAASEDTDILASPSRDTREPLAIRPTTNDLRPTTVDRQPDGATAIRGWDTFTAGVPADYRDAVDGALRAASDPAALRRQLVAMQEAITGGAAYSPAVIGQAIHELAVAGSRVTAAGLRAFCRRIAQGEREAATTTDAASEWANALKGAA